MIVRILSEMDFLLKNNLLLKNTYELEFVKVFRKKKAIKKIHCGSVTEIGVVFPSFLSLSLSLQLHYFSCPFPANTA